MLMYECICQDMLITCARERGRKGTVRVQSTVCIFCRDPKVTVYPSSLLPLTRSLCLFLSLAVQGRFLPHSWTLGCVAVCLCWSPDFLVAACTYLNIPPAAALCSRSRTPPTPPFSVSPLTFLEFLGQSDLNREKDSERRKENSFTWTHSTEPSSISCSNPPFLNGEFL